jgi:hypothetical protein
MRAKWIRAVALVLAAALGIGVLAVWEHRHNANKRHVNSLLKMVFEVSDGEGPPKHGTPYAFDDRTLHGCGGPDPDNAWVGGSTLIFFTTTGLDAAEHAADKLEQAGWRVRRWKADGPLGPSRAVLADRGLDRLGVDYTETGATAGVSSGPCNEFFSEEMPPEFDGYVLVDSF